MSVATTRAATNAAFAGIDGNAVFIIAIVASRLIDHAVVRGPERSDDRRHDRQWRCTLAVLDLPLEQSLTAE